MLLNKNLRKRYAAGIGIIVLTLSLCGGNAAAFAETKQQNSGQIVSVQENETNRLSNYKIPKDDKDSSSAITYYLNHPDQVSQKELDAVCFDYLKHTLDMKTLMKVMDSLSVETVDQMAEYYIKQSKDYEMFDEMKSYLSKKVYRKLNKYVNKAIKQALKTGKDCIDDYLKHPEKYSQEKLDHVFTDYMKEHKDIKVVLKVADHLSKDVVNQIVTTYLKDTKDWKALKSFKKYLSKDVFDELSKLAKKEFIKIFK